MDEIWYNPLRRSNLIQPGGFFIYDPQGLKWMLLRHQLRRPARVTCFKGVKEMTAHAKLLTVQCPDCKEFRQVYDQSDGKVRKCQKCGCANHKVHPYSAAKNMILKKYQRWARERSLSWDLTDEQFFELTKQPCHYCGGEPSSLSVPKRKYRDAKIEECFVYSGIDRKDNSVGYTAGNSVPCCKRCNWAKHTIPYTEFVEWLDRIVEFRCA